MIAWGSHANATADSPSAVAGNLSLDKIAHEISYSPEHRQASWVHYRLDGDDLRDCVGRGNRFAPDPEVPTPQSAALADYAGSGYDRGHLNPAGDNRSSKDAMDESFFLSNISPQPSGFNSGIWARLEQMVRAWALKYGGLTVTTGPVLEDGLQTIGGNHVSVPRFFYKVLLTPDHRQALGFLLPVEASGNIANFSTSIDRIEQATGINFFSGFSREAQAGLESGHSPANWDFGAKFRYLPCRKSMTDVDLGAAFVLRRD